MSKKDKQTSAEEKYKNAQVLGLGVMIPGMIFGCIMAGSLLGFYADKWLNTSPWLTLCGVVLGIIASIREVLKILKKINKEQ